MINISLNYKDHGYCEHIVKKLSFCKPEEQMYKENITSAKKFTCSPPELLCRGPLVFVHSKMYLLRAYIQTCKTLNHQSEK